MKLKLRFYVKILCITFIFAFTVGARIKDVVSIKGVRENMLIGYGLVVGLKGTGDSDSVITKNSLTLLFKKIGVTIDQKDIKSKNVAGVIVTSTLPPFARSGNKLDITLSSIGDAASLEGGTLLVTPLRAGDQNIYAVGQGTVSLGQVSDGSGKNFPTVGRIPNGAIIEKDLEINFNEKKSLRFTLHNPDFTTSARIARIINSELGGLYAKATDSGTVDVIIPFNYEGKGVELLAMIENLQISVDAPAKVVLNERTGTIVVGGKVMIDPVAIAHGDLTIEIKAEAGATGGGQANKKGKSFGVISGATVEDIVKALNELGVKPKDLVAIFQALKTSGALQAQLEIM